MRHFSNGYVGQEGSQFQGHVEPYVLFLPSNARDEDSGIALAENDFQETHTHVRGGRWIYK